MNRIIRILLCLTLAYLPMESFCQNVRRDAKKEQSTIQTALNQAQGRFETGNIAGAQSILRKLIEQYQLNQFPELENNAKSLLERCDNIERIAYVSAIRDLDVDKLRQFKKDYPESPYASEIDLQIDEIPFWKKAVDTNTVEGYESYLQSAPHQIYKTRALSTIEELKVENAWAAVKDSKSPDELIAYRDANLGGKYYSQASNKVARIYADAFTESSLLADKKRALSYATNGMTRDYVLNKYNKAKGRAITYKDDMSIADDIIEVDAKISSSPVASLSIDGREMGSTPSVIALEAGTYSVTLKAKNYRTLKSRLIIDGIDSTFNYTLKPIFTPNAFYATAGFQAGMMMGIAAQIGGFIGNFNIEADYVLGLTTSNPVYWNTPATMEQPTSYVYKSSFYGGKIGYGFLLGPRLRLTPQLGAGVLQIKGTVHEMGAKDPGATDGYCIPAIADMRMDYAITPNLAITLTPCGSFTVSKSDVYSRVAEGSKQIAGFGSGINVTAGLSLYF